MVYLLVDHMVLCVRGTTVGLYQVSIKDMADVKESVPTPTVHGYYLLFVLSYFRRNVFITTETAFKTKNKTLEKSVFILLTVHLSVGIFGHYSSCNNAHIKSQQLLYE